MIVEEYGNFKLVCDVCNEPADEYFDDYGSAVDGKSYLGWKSKCTDGEWEEICPECQ